MQPTQTKKSTIPVGRGRRRASRGFTLIELVTSLVVFMIAVMGLVSLQKTTLGAGDLARQQTAAVNISRFFLTQLKSEFGNWDRNQLAASLTDTAFPLLVADGSNFIADDTWTNIGADTALRMDELMGHSRLHSVDGSGDAARYCVNYMITQLENQNVDEAQVITRDGATVWLIRVRVSWSKNAQLQKTDHGLDWTDCTPSVVDQRINTEFFDNVVELVGAASREVSIQVEN